MREQGFKTPTSRQKSHGLELYTRKKSEYVKNVKELTPYQDKTERRQFDGKTFLKQNARVEGGDQKKPINSPGADHHPRVRTTPGEIKNKMTTESLKKGLNTQHQRERSKKDT